MTRWRSRPLPGCRSQDSRMDAASQSPTATVQALRTSRSGYQKLKPPRAKVDQNIAAETEGRPAISNIVDHRGSLEKVVEEHIEHSPDPGASDLVPRVTAHGQVRPTHASQARTILLFLQGPLTCQRQARSTARLSAAVRR